MWKSIYIFDLTKMPRSELVNCNFPRLMAKVILILMMALAINSSTVLAKRQHNYSDALTKSILFFEAQRSGKLPPNQRVTWRRDSALKDGSDVGVDLVGGYYDAGDNVKFNFPIAFSATVLAWGVVEYGSRMGADEQSHALDAVAWFTDYFMKATSVNDVVFAVVGDPELDHDCWERPEDMDTSRAAYSVNKNAPGSDLAGEIVAALAAASLVFKDTRPDYASALVKRAETVFKFATEYRGKYSDSAPKACPFYCSYSYEDELVWAATWLYKATKQSSYWDFVVNNFASIGGPIDNFGWDWKNGGIFALASQIAMTEKPGNRDPFISYADKFICSTMPQSPTRTIPYTNGGLLFTGGPSNFQDTTSLSFIVLTYAQYLNNFDHGRAVRCGNVLFQPSELIQLAKSQVDYILGNNPMKMSYMVGYGSRYPKMVHHRASTLPSVAKHPKPFGCLDGYAYFRSKHPNFNVLVGAVVGGPDSKDWYNDTRWIVTFSEPTTYISAPWVGLLGYFKGN